MDIISGKSVSISKDKIQIAHTYLQQMLNTLYMHYDML